MLVYAWKNTVGLTGKKVKKREEGKKGKKYGYP